MIVMTVRRVAALVLLAVAGPVLAGCGGPTDAAGGRLRVLTSFYPLQYVSARVAGDHADVTNLTQPGKEPHDIELTVQQTKAVVDADVVVYEKGFQAAVDQAVSQNGPRHVVDAADSAGLSGDDPHFWQDPTRLSRVASAVERALADVDPKHAADYRRNLAGLRSDLAALDRSYRTALSRCRITTVVVSHDAFGYLGRRYGLHFVSINGLSPDAEPSPEHLRRLQQLIRARGLTTVFSEALASPELARTLAADLGLRTGVLNTLEGLTPATRNQTYLSLMRRNLAALQKANACR